MLDDETARRWAALPGFSRRGSKSTVFGQQSRAQSAHSRRRDFGSERCDAGEAERPRAESGSKWLKRAQTQQREPMRMLLPRHHLARALGLALNTTAAHEAPVVEEELQQVQVRAANVATQREGTCAAASGRSPPANCSAAFAPWHVAPRQRPLGPYSPTQRQADPSPAQPCQNACDVLGKRCSTSASRTRVSGVSWA